jgi:hypothetical protein
MIHKIVLDEFNAEKNKRKFFGEVTEKIECGTTKYLKVSITILTDAELKLFTEFLASMPIA